MEVAGKTKKIFTYGVGLALRWIYLAISAAVLALTLIP